MPLIRYDVGTWFQLPSIAVVLYCAAAGLFLYAIGKGIYNKFFHPLGNFPGPFLGGFTEWYLVYVICSVPTFGLELHKKYGPIVRLAPNMLSFSDATMLPQVYHSGADKPTFYGSWMFGQTASMFQSLPHQDHYAKKRLVAGCCSMSSMKTHHEHKISERVDELCHVIRQRASIPGRPLDFSEYLRYFLSDTWSHLVYGRPKGFVAQGGDVQGLLSSLQGIYGMSASAAVSPWLMPLLRNPFLRKYFWSWTRTFKNMDNMFSNFDRMIDLRRTDEKLKGERLFFDGVDPANNPPNEYQYTREDLKAEVITFTAATLDGVSAFVSPFVDNLVTHPQAYARVVAEIQAADAAGLLSHPVVAYQETVDHLPFFMACIRETLRRDAPAQTILPRIVSQGGYELPDAEQPGGSVYVPAGTQMGASPYIVHRDEAVFGADADVWRPERWIQAESGIDDPKEHERYVRRMEKYGMWWGYGARECAGKYYAYMEMQKLVVEMLRRFDVESAVPEKRFTHARWAVGMFWNQMLTFRERK